MAREAALKPDAENATGPRAWQQARELDQAHREARPIAQCREAQASSLIEGFQAQAYGVALRVQEGHGCV